MKPGINTSEFKMAVAVLMLIAIGSAWTDSPVAEAAGYIGAALTTAGYGFVRASAKKSESEAQASVIRESMWKDQDDRSNATKIEVANIGGPRS